MAPPRQKKYKANRGVPVQTTMTADTTIPPPRTRILKPLCEVDVNVPTPSRRAVGSEGFFPGNSETQNIVSMVRTPPSGYQAPSIQVFSNLSLEVYQFVVHVKICNTRK